MRELFDTLAPPLFEKTGEIKDLDHVLGDSDWVQVFNLWIVQRNPVPSIVYQQRSPNASWAPLALDAAAGGYLNAGEDMGDCMREVREELGREYPLDQVVFVGRRLNVGIDNRNRRRQTVVEIGIVEDDSPIQSYDVDPKEVYAICSCPIEELIRVQTDPSYSFDVKGLDAEKKEIIIHVTKESFPLNWDPYHLKMALLAKRYLEGERYLMY